MRARIFPNCSQATSKTLFAADLDPDFLDAIRLLDREGRKRYYECRIGLSRRIVFEKLKTVLYFHFIGTHAGVKKFLKNNR